MLVEPSTVVGSGSYGTAAQDDGVDDLTAALATGLFNGLGSGKLSAQQRAPQRKPAKFAASPVPSTVSPVKPQSQSIYGTPPATGGGMFSGMGVEQPSQPSSIYSNTTLVSTPAAPTGFGQPQQLPTPTRPQTGTINLLDLDFNAPPPQTDTSSFGLIDASLFGDLTGTASNVGSSGAFANDPYNYYNKQ